MPKYIKQEMSDKLSKDGKVKTYYRVKTVHNADIEMIANRMSYTGVMKGELIKVLYNLIDTMTSFLAEGYSVSLDNLGTFRVSIGEKKNDHAAIYPDCDKHERNAASLEVRDINFKADKYLVSQVRRQTSFVRGGVSRIRKSAFTPEERLARAIAFLEEKNVMTVSDYERLNQLSHSGASRELVKLASDPSSNIDYIGRGSHKVYVLRERKG